jgi:uncharacterized protein
MPPADSPPAGGDGDAGEGPTRPPRLCPICRRPATAEVLPFCSPRCRDVDLNRWFTGSYVVPGSDQEDEE